MRKVRKKNNGKWFSPGPSLNWNKDDSQAVRRKNALKARQGDELAAARALQALANVTKDTETKRKASGDARYFYGKHRTKVKSKR